jgi:hypothetical protein
MRRSLARLRAGFTSLTAHLLISLVGRCGMSPRCDASLRPQQPERRRTVLSLGRLLRHLVFCFIATCKYVRRTLAMFLLSEW